MPDPCCSTSSLYLPYSSSRTYISIVSTLRALRGVNFAVTSEVPTSITNIPHSSNHLIWVAPIVVIEVTQIVDLSAGYLATVLGGLGLEADVLAKMNIVQGYDVLL